MISADGSGGAEGPLAAALDAFKARAGASRAALLDREGAVLAQSGFESSADVIRTGAAVAGIYGSGRRLGRRADGHSSTGPISMGGGRMIVREVGADRALLLFSAFPRGVGSDRLETAIEDLVGRLGPTDHADSDDALIASLLGRIDQAFPT